MAGLSTVIVSDGADCATRGDPDIMAGIANGDAHALGELYDRFASTAFALALRVLRDRDLAEDAVQEAFLSVWRSAANFDHRRGNAQRWILMLTHRRAVDLVQDNQRHYGLSPALRRTS